MFTYKIYLLIIVILYYFSGCSGTVKKESDVDTTENHYAAGMQKLALNDLKAAETDFLRAVELDKKSPMGYTGMALLELSRSEYRKALKRVEKALKYDNSFVDAHVARGRILTGRKKGEWFEEALASFENAFKLDPENEKALYYCAECYLTHHAFKEALNYYSRVIEKQGSLKENAKAKHSQVMNIIKADPVSKEGEKRILLEKIDRSDLCVFLIEEMKFNHLLAHNKPLLFEGIYYDDFTVRKENVTVPSDVRTHRSKLWILDIIPLHMPDLDVFTDGNFYPDRLINRSQLAMVVQGILVLLNNDPTMSKQYVGTESEFTDVRSDYYAFNAIILCVKEGILEPDPSTGVFHPYKHVSGSEAVLTIRNIERLIKSSE